MKCLYCGKLIAEGASIEEKTWRWNKRFIRSFFGTNKMPCLDISKEQLEQLANDTVNMGLTVPGVQKKLSLHLSTDVNSRLTIVNYPTGYILKPQTEEYPFMPEYEDLAMRLAETAGIQTVPHALIEMNQEYAYITRRIDREQGKVYAMEDFCQISRRLTQDKYKGSYENCARIVQKYSIMPGLDLSEIYLRIVCSFIIGNSDMHLKNFSLRETQPGNREFRLSRAYDILPVNVIMPEDKEQLALTLNGKKRNIRKKDFRVFAEACNIPDKAARHMIDRICSLKDKFICQVDESYLPQTEREELMDFINARIEILNS